MKKSVNGVRSLFVLFVAIVFSAGIAAQRPGGPDQPDTTIDAKAKTEAINALAKDLREVYVFPEVGEKVAKMLEEHQARGEYNAITSAKEFGDLVTKQMREIAHDGHLHIIYSSEVLPPESPESDQPPANPRGPQRLKKTNYAFEDVKRLDGNVGYLKFNGFTDAEQGGPTVAGAMAFLANTDAMIIDLRQNGGGSPAMVDLIASYFFDGQEPVHLNDLEYRKKGTREYTVRQWWVLPYVPGQRYVDKEVYILTSHRTFSGGEEFTNDLKELKRATIVGETTGGGANPGGAMRLGDHFSVFMPRGHAINPTSKTNWEGVGVKPDIDVPQQDALKTAQKTALEHLIAKATDEQERSTLKRALAGVEAQ